MKISHKILIPLILIIILLPVVSMASEVTFQPLEDVINEKTIIVEAKIENIKETSSQDFQEVTCDINLISVLQGSISNKIEKAVYVQPIPLIRNDKGEIIGHFSPILKASGIELFLEFGKVYLLFAEAHKNEDEILFFFRAEHLENKKRVIEILNKPH